MEERTINLFLRDIEERISSEANTAAEIESMMRRSDQGKEMAMLAELTAWSLVIRIEGALIGKYDCTECSEPITADNKGMLRFNPISFAEQIIEELYSQALLIHESCMSMLQEPVGISVKRFIFYVAMEQRKLMNLAINGILMSVRRENK